ncbi:PilN domain-containing protein [Vibrio tubiashii]|uniref:PilN domain-containing protein n=1 Tax=Vibrio tubiashii TaxID=29498 RepID=UPI001EFCD085|nr:PilN domain-containing protein [Vibrio tubiashii]MCG9576182.1 PilN domain-containing protein [Vibrio tubiashii]
MLHSINLLPWREELRDYRQKRIRLLMMVTLIIAVIIQWGIGSYIEQQQDRQSERNDYLVRHGEQLDQQLNQLKIVEREHQALLTRLSVIEGLQKERNKTTDFMNLLPELIPAGVYIDKLEMNGLQVELAGISDSTSHLATMLDNLEKSPAVTNVEMHSIVHGTARFASKYQSYRVSFSLLGGQSESLKP